MNKKIAIIVGVLIITLGVGTTLYIRKASSLKKQLASVRENLESYTLKGDMKTLDGEDLKEYLVEVSFIKYEGNEYFKVALHDKLTNQDQIIIKNLDGVFVITPSLNRAFQFKSEWPYNSLKPYIYQSLLEMFDSNHTVEKSKDGYLVTADVNYVTNPNAVRQEVKFTKDLSPIYVNVLSEEDIELIQLDVTEFSINPKIEMNEFDIYQYVDTSSTTAAEGDSDSNTTSAVDEFPLYPMEIMGSVLSNEEELTINGVINHVLQFSGENSFKIVESATQTSSTFRIEEQSGELIDLIGSFGIYQNNELQVIDASYGMVCQIYSNDLALEDMISVISSLQQVALK